jgi:2-phosphosulfolactate phosphatase
VIVDVLAFSTSVDIAGSRVMRIFPYGGLLEEAPAFARCHDAELAQLRGKGRFSLSPAAFATAPQGGRIVLLSPNGSTHTLLAAESSLILCGCLRNAAAIAAACEGYDSVGLVPAGER